VKQLVEAGAKIPTLVIATQQDNVAGWQLPLSKLEGLKSEPQVRVL
jgi:hypothetical protein